MATSTKTPNSKEEQDYARNPSQQHYDDEFNKIVGNQPSTAEDLQKLEDYANSNPGGGADEAEKYANDPSGNIRNTKEKEEDGGWRNSYTGGSEKGNDKQPAKGNFSFLKRKGPLGLIIGLLSVTGLLGSGTFFSSMGLVNFKELAVEKLDSMTSVMQPRSELGLALRMFGVDDATSKTCAIKVKCRFKGLTERQLQRLEIQGAQLVDASGKRVTKNPVTKRYTGGQKLIMPNGEAVDATQFRAALRDKSSSELRTLVRSVFSPRYMSWNDSVARDIRAKKKLVSNPDWGKEGDEKEANKSIAKAVAGDSPGVTTDPNTKYTTDENGNQVPEKQASGSENLDLGEDAENIQDEAEKLKEKAASGELVSSLPDDTAEVATLPKYEGKFSATQGLKSVIGFFNPADVFTGLCTTYQMANVMLIGASTLALVNAMRYASQFLSTADKLKAGEATPDDIEKAMNILQKENLTGDSFGDSFTYNFIAYGAVTSIPLGSSARGNDTIRTLSTVMNTVNSSLGGASTVRTACNILTNPFTQVALSLTSFIPGAGALGGSLAKISTKGAIDAAKQLIKDKIASLVEAIAKNASKDGLKNAASAARSGLLSLAKNPSTAIFLGGFLIERYGVPYLAQTIAGTEFVGANGMKAADGIGNGFDATNSATAQPRGLTPLNKNEYKAFAQYNNETTATYVADMQKETSPLDFNSPYSIGSRVASAVYPVTSRLDVTSNPKNLLSLPSSILSSLNPSKLLSNTTYADEADVDAELSYCQDEYLQTHNVATSPYCNVKYGFNDTNMLNNVDPDAIINWMLDNGQIDNEGNPTPGSEFADFKSKCIDGTEDKIIGDIGESDQQIDPECYGDKNNTQQFKTFRLYLIDNSVTDGMDDVQKTSTASQTSSAAPEECKTMAADDLGQIACHAYQFDPYGYKWGGGHSGTAQDFMNAFKANQYTPGQDHILDCSGLVRMAIFDATGQDIGGMATSGYTSFSKFKEVSKQESKAGDILWRDGHTEIIVSNDPGTSTWKTIGAHQVYPDINKDIGPTSYGYGAFTKVYRFQK